MGTSNSADDDPETTTLADRRPVRGDARTSPDSFYGASKAACENLTKYYAERHGIEVVNLRIGWYVSEDDLRERTGDDVDPGKDRYARATWLRPRDCRAVLRRAATADLPETPVTVNAVFHNDQRYFTLTETMRSLGSRPRDNADEVLERCY